MKPWTRSIDGSRAARRGTLASAVVAALLCATALAPTAHATVMVEVPLEQLLAEADLVVHGRVVRTGVRLAPNAEGHLEPHTVSVVQLLEVLSGAPESAEVVIDELGGRTQGVEMRIVGTPEYRRGEQLVVFLRALGDGSYRTIAMAQGHFEVLPGIGRAEAVVVRDTRAIAMASWVRGRMQLEHGQRAEMPLPSFLAYLRELAERELAERDLAERGGAR